MQARIDELEASLRTRLDQARNERDSLHARISAQNEEIANLLDAQSSECAALRLEIKQLQQRLKEMDEQIKVLQATLDGYAKDIEQNKNDIAELKRRYTDFLLRGF